MIRSVYAAHVIVAHRDSAVDVFGLHINLAGITFTMSTITATSKSEQDDTDLDSSLSNLNAESVSDVQLDNIACCGNATEEMHEWEGVGLGDATETVAKVS
eukprot:gene9239-biopygen8282